MTQGTLVEVVDFLRNMFITAFTPRILISAMDQETTHQGTNQATLVEVVDFLRNMFITAANPRV